MGDTTGAYCWYNNDLATYKATYGALYNWYAVNNAKGLVYFERNSVHETGWRVPSMADFTKLIAFLDGSVLAGGKLKEVGITHWDTPNTGASDIFGFKALPAGVREQTGAFIQQGSLNVLWSSTEQSTDNAQSEFMEYDISDIINAFYEKTRGFSVRCVRDIYVATVYVTFTDPLNTNILWRKGVRSGQLRVDVTLTLLGFSGIEGVDWENIKST
jgi:uncharacterized protein (TIGR02145 family)